MGLCVLALHDDPFPCSSLAAYADVRTMNWTESANGLVDTTRLLDTAWYDRPMRTEKRISKLEHELGVNCNPCSDEMCYKCNPNKVVRVGGIEKTIKEIYDRQIMMSLVPVIPTERINRV